jgi:hypothetical protein
MNDDPRAALLRRLVAYELPIEPVLEALAELPRGCDDDLALVAPEDVVRIIDRCASGELTIAQATDWADLLEARDGVGFASPHGGRVAATVSRIANPDLHGPVTVGVLAELRAALVHL